MKIAYDSHIKLGLERVEKALKLLRLRFNEFNSILIGGTNGKGTTAFYIERIIRKHGLRTALFLSPHLEDVGERLLICGKETEGGRIEKTYREIERFLTRRKVETTPFETLTLCALKIAQEEDAQWFIAEVGMGGRLDATNILNAKVSVITTVSMDHTQYLGERLREIAWEKAGIIKRRAYTVVGNMPDEALKVVENVARERESFLFKMGRDFTYRILEKDSEKTLLCWSFEGEDLIFSIPCPFQFIVHNVCLSLAASKLALKKISEKATREALNKKPPKARAEVLRYKSTSLIVDVAHNVQALETLLHEVKTIYNPQRLAIFLSPLKDKDYTKMIKIALDYGELYLVKQDTKRGIDEGQTKLGKWIQVEKIRQVLEETKPELAVFTGSFWMAKTARRIFTCPP